MPSILTTEEDHMLEHRNTTLEQGLHTQQAEKSELTIRNSWNGLVSSSAVISVVTSDL
jgi:hypothetical protein